MRHISLDQTYLLDETTEAIIDFFFPDVLFDVVKRSEINTKIYEDITRPFNEDALMRAIKNHTQAQKSFTNTINQINNFMKQKKRRGEHELGGAVMKAKIRDSLKKNQENK